MTILAKPMQTSHQSFNLQLFYRWSTNYLKDNEIGGTYANKYYVNVQKFYIFSSCIMATFQPSLVIKIINYSGSLNFRGIYMCVCIYKLNP